MKALFSLMLSLVLLCVLAACGLRSHAQTAPAFLLFGGEGHKTFLGCLNCGATGTDSVCNRFGTYGSQFETNSIWNKFGPFGSKFESGSPWNQFTDEAPIIVDADGNSYGYFSANAFHHDRTKIKPLVAVLDYFKENGDLDDTRNLMCGD